MGWIQYCVVAWMQFAIDATILLGLSCLSLRWITQPVERLRLILVVLIAVLALPWVIAFSSVPSWRLGWIAADYTQPDKAIPFHIESESGTPPVVMKLRGFAAVPPMLTSTEPQTAPAGSFTTVVQSTPTLHLSVDRLHTTENRPWFAALDVWTTLGLCVASLHVLVGGLFLVERIIGRKKLNGLCRNSTQATEAVSDAWRRIAGLRGARVQILISKELTSPLMFGWWRPVVIVPQSIANRGGLELDGCLAHEWSHLDRRDVLAWRLTTFCQYLLWYQPTYWVLRRELRICQEFMADHRSTKHVIEPIQYSELLMTMAKGRGGLNVAESLSMFERQGQLTRRINLLLFHHGTLNDRCRKTFTISALVLVAMSTIAISSLRMEADANATEQIDWPEPFELPEQPEEYPQHDDESSKNPKTPQVAVEPETASPSFPRVFGRTEIVGRSVSYRSVQTVRGKATEERRYFIAPDGRERTEFKYFHGKVVRVMDSDYSTMLTLVENSKSASRLQNLGLFRIFVHSRGNLTLRILQIYKDSVLSDRKAKDLGNAIVGGKKAQGYSTANGLTVWIDPISGDLVQVEQEFLLGLGGRETLSDFRFDADMDESLFSLEVPEGYKLIDGWVSRKDVKKVEPTTLDGLQKVWGRLELLSDLETAPDASISSAWGQLVSRNEQGKQIARTTVGSRQTPRLIRSSLADTNGKYLLFHLNEFQFLDGTVGASIYANYVKGKRTWRYPENSEMTNEVNDLCVADLGGDKKTKIVVGLTKDGLQVLDENGHAVWKNPNVSITGNIEPANVDSDIASELLCSSSQGDLLVIDSDGTLLRKIDPGFASHMVRAWSPTGSTSGQLVILSAGTSRDPVPQGKEPQTKLVAIDIGGNQKWSVDLSGRVIDSAIATNRPWLSVVLADGSMRVIDVSSGKDIASLESHTATSSARVAWLPIKNADPLLVVGISFQTTAYRIGE